MTPSEIVHAFLIRQCSVAPDREVDPLMSLRTNLKMDALDFVELHLTLEQNHGIDVPGQQLLSVDTVGDPLSLVQQRLN